MAVRNRARTEEEFIYLINQALDEVFDLRAAIELDTPPTVISNRKKNNGK